MNILVIGAGGREHAISKKTFSQSEGGYGVLCARKSGDDKRWYQLCRYQ